MKHNGTWKKDRRKKGKGRRKSQINCNLLWTYTFSAKSAIIQFFLSISLFCSRVLRNEKREREAEIRRGREGTMFFHGIFIKADKEHGEKDNESLMNQHSL